MSRVLLPLLLLFAAVRSVDAAPRGWWDRKWSHRERVVLSGSQRWPDAPAAHVRLATGGRARPDGADIRIVTAAGREVPRAVVTSGPGDLFEVAFPPGRDREWWVYYGNPEAKEPEDAFVPDRGLVLTTYRRGPGTPDSWAGMERILRGSREVFGGSYWKRVFDAENPFGPSDDFVSDYRGHVLCPADGAYTFFTASDEASFLLIDDRLVVQWPGWHDAKRGAWATFKGRVDLKAGLHRFRYVHVERTGAQVMAAYWQPPGAAKATVIPESAFPGLRAAQSVATEALAGGVTADFYHQVGEKWALDEQVYSALVFHASLLPAGAEYAWRFGDGTTGTGPVGTHVYLGGGNYDVALTVRVGGQEDTVVRAVHVPDQWTRFDRNSPLTLKRFARLAAGYPGRRLSAEHLARLDFLLTEAERTVDLAPVYRDAVAESESLDERARHRAALRLGEIYRDLLHDRAGALWAFRQASSNGNRGERLTGQVALAEAILQLGGDAATALRLLDSAIEALAGKAGDAIRTAWLRSGDAWMIEGDRARARECYEKAQALAGGAENSQRILRKAGAARSAMTHLETGELVRAGRDLREWEWNDPMDRFRGFHRIARAKLLLAAGQPDLAARELTALLSGNPESEYADTALFLLATLERNRGNEAKAEAWLEKLRRDYPWSPLGK